MKDEDDRAPKAGIPVRNFTAEAALPALAGDGVVRFRDLDVTAAKLGDRRIFFATDKVRDPIQRTHRHGKFFEEEDLGLIGQHFPKGGTFVDIGSNVGNHSLYAGIALGAARIIPFEPNPLAYRLLTLNVLLNGLEDIVVFDHIGLGVSDTDEGGFGMEERHKNLGAARMLAGEGDIRTVRGDDALTDESPDFIKIDVEGMEMGVLRGLEDTLARCRPPILIEVDKANYEAFDDWRVAHKYEAAHSIQHWATNTNFLLVPEERK